MDRVEVRHFVQREHPRNEANHKKVRGLVQSGTGDAGMVFGEEVSASEMYFVGVQAWPTDSS